MDLRDVKLKMMSSSNASAILFYKKYALVLIASMATGLCGMSYALSLQVDNSLHPSLKYTMSQYYQGSFLKSL